MCFYSHSSHLWSIILAAGDGIRAQPFIRQWLGHHVPKQYCTFVGTRSMFQHTVDRADRLTPPERRITVVAAGHEADVNGQWGDRNPGLVLAQPTNRGTAAGLYLALTYVRAVDPEARVLIYPCDHFVYPESRFIETAKRLLGSLEKLGNRLVLLGARPTTPEPEYGWILPGEHLLGNGHRGFGVRSVEGFLEKPDRPIARAAMLSGAVWNTLFMAGDLPTLWRSGWRALPEVMELFERLGESIRTKEERQTLETVYSYLEARDFSAEVLQRWPDRLAVLTAGRELLWSDWGRPERIVASLRAIGQRPAFPDHLVAYGASA